MNAVINPKAYNHAVFAASNAEQACVNWGYVFDKTPPVLRYIGKNKLAHKLKLDVSEYRHTAWTPDFSQAVLELGHTFFEIDGPGEHDYFRDFIEENGNGICYMGFYLGKARDPFVKRIMDEYGCDVVTYQKLETPKLAFDWAIVDTNRVLGCDLCIKEFAPGISCTNPFVGDFTEYIIHVTDLDKAEAGWRSLFALTDKDIRRGSCTDGSKALRIDSLVIPVVLLEAADGSPIERISPRHKTGIIGAVLPSSVDKNAIGRLKELSDGDFTTTFEAFEKRYTLYASADAMGTNLAVGV